jgi:predicted PurR-regulated permease PerM
MLERMPFESASVRLTQLPVMIGIVFGLLVFWFVGEVFLVAFAGLLIAIFLNTLAAWLGRFLHLSYRWSLFIVCVVLLALFGAMTYFIGARIAEQASQLMTILPQSIAQLRRWLEQYVQSSWLHTATPVVFGEITGIARSSIRLIIDLVIMILVGVYLASEPHFYAAGLVRLVPLDKRDRARQVMQRMASDVRWWMLGKIISMVAVGVVIGVAMWLIGMPLELALGLLAGVLELVPIVGPILWLFPALLVALMQGWHQVFDVCLVYCGLHLLESYVLIPVVQRRAVWLPPGITIVSIMFLTLTQGVLGIMTAAPLAVATITLVRMLYVEDVLGDRGS